MDKLSVLNCIAETITGETQQNQDVLSALNAIASKGAGETVQESDISSALNTAYQNIENIIGGGGGDIEENKTATITQKGSIEITPSSPYTSMAKVTATASSAAIPDRIYLKDTAILQYAAEPVHFASGENWTKSDMNQRALFFQNARTGANNGVDAGKIYLNDLAENQPLSIMMWGGNPLRKIGDITINKYVANQWTPVAQLQITYTLDEDLDEPITVFWAYTGD